MLFMEYILPCCCTTVGDIGLHVAPQLEICQEPLRIRHRPDIRGSAAQPARPSVQCKTCAAVLIACPATMFPNYASQIEPSL